jgi:ribosomal protein S8
MVRISVLHDALKTMYNAEKRGKRQVLIRPASKVVIKFLQLMMRHGYIGEFEFVDDHRAGKIVVNLNGRLNKCGCISPRYDVGHDVRLQYRRYGCFAIQACIGTDCGNASFRCFHCPWSFGCRTRGLASQNIGSIALFI